MKVEVLTEKKYGEYHDFLSRYENSQFVSSLLFKDFFHLICPSAIPYYFICLEDDHIVGSLPSFLMKGPIGPVLNSLPWFGSNPGIIAEDYSVAQYLFQAFEHIAKWTGCFSSTMISPPHTDQEIYDDFFDKRENEVFKNSRVGLITPLPSFDKPELFAQELLKMMHQKTRNQIIKASQKCMIFESYENDDWDFLKRVHKENMEAVGGMVKNKEFDIIRKHFKRKTDYKLYVAISNDDQAVKIAALLMIYFNKTVEYITPAIVAQYRHLCPMNLLIFSAMGDAAQLGIKWWNWGGTKLPQMEGLYHFKKRFGASESKYQYYTQIYGNLSMKISPEWLAKQYPYFFVMPYSLLDLEG